MDAVGVIGADAVGTKNERDRLLRRTALAQLVEQRGPVVITVELDAGGEDHADHLRRRSSMEIAGRQRGPFNC